MPLLVDALVTLGRGDGWGTTNANAAALLALAELHATARTARPGRSRVKSKARASSQIAARRADARRCGYRVGAAPGAGELAVRAAAPAPSSCCAETSLPAARAAAARSPPRPQGFVVTRETAEGPGRRRAAEPRARSTTPARRIDLAVGDVVEEHVQLVNPEDRHYVAVVIPLAAGMEPLNPALATAPPEAKPTGRADAGADLRRLPRRPGGLLLRHPAARAPSTSPSARAPQIAGPLHPAGRLGRDDVRRRRARQLRRRAHRRGRERDGE